MTELHVGDRVVVMPFTPDSDPGEVVASGADATDVHKTAVRVSDGRVVTLLTELLRKVPDGADRMGNLTAKDGQDHCPCGSPYWEFDTCIDCRVVFSSR